MANNYDDGSSWSEEAGRLARKGLYGLADVGSFVVNSPHRGGEWLGENAGRFAGGLIYGEPTQPRLTNTTMDTRNNPRGMSAPVNGGYPLYPYRGELRDPISGVSDIAQYGPGPINQNMTQLGPRRDNSEPVSVAPSSQATPSGYAPGSAAETIDMLISGKHPSQQPQQPQQPGQGSQGSPQPQQGGFRQIPSYMPPTNPNDPGAMSGPAIGPGGVLQSQPWERNYLAGGARMNPMAQSFNGPHPAKGWQPQNPMQQLSGLNQQTDSQIQMANAGIGQNPKVAASKMAGEQKQLDRESRERIASGKGKETAEYHEALIALQNKKVWQADDAKAGLRAYRDGMLNEKQLSREQKRPLYSAMIDSMEANAIDKKGAAAARKSGSLHKFVMDEYNAGRMQWQDTKGLLQAELKATDDAKEREEIKKKLVVLEGQHPSFTSIEDKFASAGDDEEQAGESPMDSRAGTVPQGDNQQPSVAAPVETPKTTAKSSGLKRWKE